MDRIETIIKAMENNKFNDYIFINKEEICEKMGWDDFNITSHCNLINVDCSKIIGHNNPDLNLYIIDISPDHYSTFKIEKDNELKAKEASIEFLALIDDRFDNIEDIRLVFSLYNQDDGSDVDFIDSGVKYNALLQGFVIKPNKEDYDD